MHPTFLKSLSSSSFPRRHVSLILAGAEESPALLLKQGRRLSKHREHKPVAKATFDLRGEIAVACSYLLRLHPDLHRQTEKVDSNVLSQSTIASECSYGVCHFIRLITNPKPSLIRLIASIETLSRFLCFSVGIRHFAVSRMSVKVGLQLNRVGYSIYGLVTVDYIFISHNNNFIPIFRFEVVEIFLNDTDRRSCRCVHEKKIRTG